MTPYQWFLMILKAWGESSSKLQYTPPPAPEVQYPVIMMITSNIGRIVFRGKIT